MSTNNFKFDEFCLSLESMMTSWYQYSKQAFRHPTNLGGAREYFVKDILSKFLPKSVDIGSGEIIDGKSWSGQQDIIIYRNDYPVIKGFNDVNTYLIDGVIATIEVKSDLSTGDLKGAFGNVKKVLGLEQQAFGMRGSLEDLKLLQKLYSVKTFVIGFNGWEKIDSLLENYRNAAIESSWIIPDLVYQPNFCLIKSINMNNIFDNYKNPHLFPSNQIAVTSINPFAVFLQQLLQAILIRTGGLRLNAPGLDAEMVTNINQYFSMTPSTGSLYSL